jgi:Lrp/AsnC family transcriptional regulator, leucine-responsive regulatory protein
MKRLRFENGQADAVDARIISALAEDGRLSTAELGRRIGLSAPSVAERVRRLEEAGIIEGYSARINVAALGYALSAYLRIRPVPGQLGKVAEILRSIPQISTCDRVTGEDCFIAQVHVASIAELEELIDRIIPFAMTNTAIVQSTPVPRRLPPITGPEQ